MYSVKKLCGTPERVFIEFGSEKF